MSSNYPNFKANGYQIEAKLGTNDTNGRITYKATQIKTDLPVVIKEFQFDRDSSDWSGYDSFCAEKEILSQLEHPGIPKYLDYFETSSGFCLVSEYKPGVSLARAIEFTPEEIKDLALELLSILIYLQQQPAPIVHRDIKPENILVDNCGGQLQVYLLDFGSATLLGVRSSDRLVRGTLGFMPPEQALNLGSSLATDLYSLGVTLICLLTQTRSTDVANLIDDRYRINFKSYLPQLNPNFVRWLEKMTHPQQKFRFYNAINAYSALSSIDPTHSPLLTSATGKQLTTGFAVVAVVAGFLGAFSALQYQCSFKSQTSSSSSVSIEPAPSDSSFERSLSPQEFVPDEEVVGAEVVGVPVADACSQLTGLGQYRGYIGDGSAFIATNDIPCAYALDNCQLNARSNPDRDTRCTWNGVEIFSTRD